MLHKTKTVAAAIATAVALAAPAGAQDLRNPDQRAPAATPATQDLRNPDTIDASRGVVASSSQPAATASGSSGTFDWGDAGIGAAAMLGLIALAGGTALIGSHVRSRGRFPASSH